MHVITSTHNLLNHHDTTYPFKWPLLITLGPAFVFRLSFKLSLGALSIVSCKVESRGDLTPPSLAVTLARGNDEVDEKSRRDNYNLQRLLKWPFNLRAIKDMSLRRANFRRSWLTKGTALSWIQCKTAHAITYRFRSNVHRRKMTNLIICDDKRSALARNVSFVIFWLFDPYNSFDSQLFVEY